MISQSQKFWKGSKPLFIGLLLLEYNMSENTDTVLFIQ